MYISKIKIENFRCFKSTTVEFRPGINVIIGENNGGKSALLAAMARVFDSNSRRRPEFYDLHQGIEDYSRPPEISIGVTLSSSGKDTSEDKGMVAAWVTKLTSPWEASLTYKSFLPEEEKDKFQEQLGENPTRDDFYRVVRNFLPRYITRVFGGNPDDQLVADPELLKHFDYQFLDALRDAKSELFSGSNPLLNSMLKEVLDLQTSNGGKSEKFQEEAKALLSQVVGRIDDKSLFQLVSDTGAGDGGGLSLEGEINEHDFIVALKLFVEKSGFRVPMTHNGLGYNNLVYISLILAQIDVRSDPNKLGQNSINFPMLFLEEPEAHLHPTLQYKLLRYLRQRITDASRCRQAFITTHSTHITAASSLDEIICMMAADEHLPTGVAYPGKVFGEGEGEKSRKYVERFLDATKSNMLFAKAIIFVEGIAEQLLVPQLSESLCAPLDKHQVALIRVDGSTFKHFIPLFGGGISEDLRKFALTRPVVCIADGDPKRKQKDTKGARWKGSWPFLMERDPVNYEYAPVSGVVRNLRENTKDSPNIRIENSEKTFEYDLALTNACNEAILTDTSNVLRSFCTDPEGEHSELADLLSQEENDAIAAISDPIERRKVAFAAYYLSLAEVGKGEHAFDLAVQMRDGTDGTQAITVPKYIEDAISFACGKIKEQAEAMPDGLLSSIGEEG